MLRGQDGKAAVLSVLVSCSYHLNKFLILPKKLYKQPNLWRIHKLDPTT